MATILGTKWKVKNATPGSPFKVDDEFEITNAAEVKHNGKTNSGTHISGKDKVTVISGMGSDEYWEFVVSETVDNEFALFGIKWTTTGPDAMASWVCDPQS